MPRWHEETPNELWGRFMAKVVEKRNGCLVWKTGDAKLWLAGKPQWAHRVHYFIVHDKWPPTNLRRTCKTKGCVNCAHYALDTDPQIAAPRRAKLRAKIALMQAELARLSSGKRR